LGYFEYSCLKVNHFLLFDKDRLMLFGTATGSSREKTREQWTPGKNLVKLKQNHPIKKQPVWINEPAGGPSMVPRKVKFRVAGMAKSGNFV
jgi:hypothetical protein